MRPARTIKILVPVLLLATTLFPIYGSEAGGGATSIFGLLADLPAALIVPILFAGSILFAPVETKWSSVQSAVLAVMGIIAAFIVNELTVTTVATPEPYTSIALILYVIVTPLTYLVFLIRKLVRRHKKQQPKPKPTHVPFLSMPVRRYVILMIISGGLYYLYWHYVNWKAVKVREGSNISPLWRTFFTLFWIYALFKRIIGAAEKDGRPARFSAGLLASLYIAVAIAQTVLTFVLTYGQGMVMALTVLTLFVLITIPVQQAANAGVPVKGLSGKSPSLGEVMIVVIGASLLFANVYGVARNPNVTLIEDMRNQYHLVKNTFQLSVDYAECSADLSQRYPLLDTSDQSAVDAYNADHEKCEAKRLELNKLIEESEHRSRFNN